MTDDRPADHPDLADFGRTVDKLRKINAALMKRVERSMDQQANAFSLFQTAISQEAQIKLRTDELNHALSKLAHGYDPARDPYGPGSFQRPYLPSGKEEEKA